MELTPMHKRVIALDVHQAKITACAVVEHDDGRVDVTKRDFGAFKLDRRALAQWSLQIKPEVVVMQSSGVYWKCPFAALEPVGYIPPTEAEANYWRQQAQASIIKKACRVGSAAGGLNHGYMAQPQGPPAAPAGGWENESPISQSSQIMSI